jgi:hypothetical protein
MIRTPSITAFAISSVLLLLPLPGRAQLAYQGTRMGESYKVYIYRKSAQGPGLWRFQTKAIYASGASPYVSPWQVADCGRATLDGKPVPVTPRFGYEEGQPEIFQALCGIR